MDLNEEKLTRLDPENKSITVKSGVYGIADSNNGVNTVKIDENILFQVETILTKSKNSWKVLNTCISKTIIQEKSNVEKCINFHVLSDMEIEEYLNASIEDSITIIIFLMSHSNISNDLRAKNCLYLI